MKHRTLNCGNVDVPGLKLTPSRWTRSALKGKSLGAAIVEIVRRTMMEILQNWKSLTANARGIRSMAGLLVLSSILFLAIPVFALQSQKTNGPVTPSVHRLPQPGNTFTINNTPIRLPQSEPDPFDMLVSSAASFDIDSPVEARTEFDPPVATVGGRVVYRVTVSALDESLTMPDKLPAPKGLELHQGGRGQTYQRTGGTKLRPQTTVIYRMTVTNSGTFTIPGYDLMAYGKPVKVPAATLTVVPAGTTNTTEPPTVLVELPKEDCYVGQLLKIPILWPLGAGGGVGGLFQPHISGEFIFSEQMPMGLQIGNIEHDGKTISACVQDVLITPLKAGTQELIAQGHATVMRP
ncbi:MAG TPA: BatD family protein, partial [Verrucomicrobiae bacterium]|nr:BatD family protein [Verrucomicrobiae bacterium]